MKIEEKFLISISVIFAILSIIGIACYALVSLAETVADIKTYLVMALIFIIIGILNLPLSLQRLAFNKVDITLGQKIVYGITFFISIESIATIIPIIVTLGKI